MKTIHSHAGIPCSIRSPKACQAIRTVLRKVKSCSEKDFERIQGLVISFEPLEELKAAEGTRGCWKREGLHADDDERSFDARGILQLWTGDENLVSLVAHELGHVCTRAEDFEKRDGYDGEWASEMCADYYAYRWGFGREIARRRKHRNLGHHGFGRGTVFTEESPNDGVVYRFRVTRAFYIQLLQTETKDGKVIETAAQREARLLRKFEENTRRK